MHIDERRVTERFAAVDDDGNEYTVEKETGFHKRRLPDGSHKSFPVEEVYRLDDGSPLNVLGEDTFQLSLRGTVIRRVR
jgi:hypothetical protein